jgi:hypothetical protein
MSYILLISIANEYILFVLHLCPLCNYYIKGCRKLLAILIVWDVVSLLWEKVQQANYDCFVFFVRQLCRSWNAIDRHDDTVQILLLSIWKEYLLFALHPWPLCNYNNGYMKLLIMLILYDCFLFLEWEIDEFYHATNWDGVYGFLSLFFSAITPHLLSTFNLLVGCVSLGDLVKALFDTL